MIDLVPCPDQAEVSSGANRINFPSSVIIEWVQAGLGNDIVRGNSANTYLQGRNLDDRLFGRGGDDKLFGDTAVFSDQGNDLLNGDPGRDILDGGPVGDTFYARDGEAGEIDCGDGADRVITADPSLDSQSFSCIGFVDPGP